MDLLTILLLVVIGIVALKIFGTLIRIVVTIGLVLLIIYVIQQVIIVNIINY